MARTPAYGVVVVGGGPGGLTTALYTTRLGHRTALVDAAGGRHASVAHVHNVIGVSEQTSGTDLERVSKDQLTEYGTDLYEDEVTGVERVGGDGSRGKGERGDGQFRIEAERATLRADRVVLATGFADEPPRVERLRRFTGRGLHYCLHCDAYTLGDERVFVLGHDDHAAKVAMILLNFTPDVDLLTNGAEPTWDDDTAAQVAAHPVDRVDKPVERALAERELSEGAMGGDSSATAESDLEPWLGGLEFSDGTIREYAGGFAMYGREFDAALADALGCERRDDGAVAVDERRETSVDGVYAVGDLTHGQNQTPVAMGDGAYAGLAVDEDLRTFPIPADELDGDGVDAEVPAVADDLRARMRRLDERGVESGMTPDRG